MYEADPRFMFKCFFIGQQMVPIQNAGNRTGAGYLSVTQSQQAGVHMEDIVDDELDLPEKLPGNVRYKGIKRKSTSPRR